MTYCPHHGSRKWESGGTNIYIKEDGKTKKETFVSDNDDWKVIIDDDFVEKVIVDGETFWVPDPERNEMLSVDRDIYQRCTECGAIIK